MKVKTKIKCGFFCKLCRLQKAQQARVRKTFVGAVRG